jgi:hypothetical protein
MLMPMPNAEGRLLARGHAGAACPWPRQWPTQQVTEVGCNSHFRCLVE